MISRAVFYLKEHARRSNVLWLLFASSIRVVDSGRCGYAGPEGATYRTSEPLILTPQFEGLWFGDSGSEDEDDVRKDAVEAADDSKDDRKRNKTSSIAAAPSP
eukprot:285023_1